MKDFWLSLTLIGCFVAILVFPVCALSFLAAAKRADAPSAGERVRRVRIDLRAPSLVIGVAAAALAWASYRRYVRYLRIQK